MNIIIAICRSFVKISYSFCEGFVFSGEKKQRAHTSARACIVYKYCFMHNIYQNCISLCTK